MDKWLPSGQCDEVGVERFHLLEDFLRGHLLEIVTLHGVHGVTIGTAEIASEQPDEYGRGACANPLAFDTEEDF